MTTIEITASSDEEGKVRLAVPVGAPHARVQVTLTVEDASRRRAVTIEEHRVFLDRVLGTSDDATFQIPPDQAAEDVRAL